MTELKLPEVGDNITQATVVAILVKAGDTVSAGQAIVEIETDKAVVEVPAEAGGVVGEVKVKAGDTVPVGGVLLTLAGGQHAPASTPPETKTAPAPSVSSTTEVKLPEVGDNITQATVVAVLVKVGDTLQAGQAVAEIETDKAVVEVPAEAGGTVSEVKIKAGDVVPVGGVLLLVSGGNAAPQPTPQAASQATPAQTPAPAQVAVPVVVIPAAAPVLFNGRHVVPASPSVRRLARELGVDINTVPGSGVAGRITDSDVRNTVSGAVVAAPSPVVTTPVQAAAPSPAPVAVPALPDFSKWGKITTEDMNGVRKATVRSMAQAWSTVPMVTHFDKADITHMEQVRKQYAAKVEKMGAKLTMTAILLKVVAGALRKFPKFNASIDTVNNQVIFKDYVHLGVAVDTPVGLLVPVLKDADKKGIVELGKELNDLAAKARERKLSPAEMQGGTFSVSNLGGIGGHAFTPIVNPPEVAILGVSRSSLDPVWNAEKAAFEPKLMMPLSLTYDHRLIDGADAARFVRYICETLEDPFLMSL